MNINLLLANVEEAATTVSTEGHTEAVATEAAGNGGIGALFTALGLNVPALVLNTAAFLLIVWVLGKFVYPTLIKALDAKKDEFEAAARMEHEAKEALSKAEDKAGEALAEARRAADEILASAKADATAQIEAARTKATEQSERLVTEAHEQLNRDVLAARKELKSETAKLVAEVSGAVLNEKLNGDNDTKLINRSLEAK